MSKGVKIFITGAVLILTIVIVSAIYFWPVSINENIDGILYRGNLPQYSENYTLVMEGHYYRNPFSKNEFLGRFYIDGIDLPDKLEQSGNVNIKFDKKGQGALYYQSNEPEDGLSWFSIGSVYFDINDQKVVVAVFDGAGTGSGEWNSGDGLIFAAPAANRSEALAVTNELMRFWLIKPIK